MTDPMAEPAEPDAKDMPVTRPWKDASPDFQSGYRAGWADREADILCGIDRIKPTATGEGDDAYKGKVGGADGIVRPVMSWAERVQEAEARPAAPPLCDPECVHCAAWRGR